MTMQTQIADIQVQSPFVEFWNDTLAPKFIKYRHVLEGGLSRHSAEVLPRLDVPEGGNVLDVGCGFGDTAVALALKTGPKGRVLGVDCCEEFLDIARHRPERMFVPNVSFRACDAEKDLGTGDYDYVFSRFGTMFFANPVAGLRAMCRSLKPGAQVAHIVWRRREDNPWLNEAAEIMRSFLPDPGPGGQSCGPGPFSMADELKTAAQMRAAGFTDIRFQRIDAKVLVGNDIDDAVAFQVAIGPAGEIYREAGAAGVARRVEIVLALGEHFEAHREKTGGLWMDSSSWLITARAPT